MVKKYLYQDRYNQAKTWQVCHMQGAMYLKQFINGVQHGRGVRCNKKFIRDIGIFNFEMVI